MESLGEIAETRRSEILGYLEKIEGEHIRSMILDKGSRIGGRRLQGSPSDFLRVGILPRTHGSALFTRGEPGLGNRDPRDVFR